MVRISQGPEIPQSYHSSQETYAARLSVCREMIHLRIGTLGSHLLLVTIADKRYWECLLLYLVLAPYRCQTGVRSSLHRMNRAMTGEISPAV